MHLRSLREFCGTHPGLNFAKRQVDVDLAADRRCCWLLQEASKAPRQISVL